MNKAVLITGCAKRIGREIAIRLASSGYDIAIHYNNSINDAKILYNEIKKFGVDVEIFGYDLSDEKSTEFLINDVYGRFNNLEVLINNASIFIRAKMLDTSIELFNKTVNINLKAPYILSRDFAKIIKKGVIINILDTKISKNNYNYSVYTLTKKALADLTLMSAKEFAPDIRVNGVCPGLILEPEGKDKSYLDELAKNLPLKRKGEPKDIVNAVEFLITNQYITGEILYVDGGERL
jgi:NAD(P)-dependent dehydrogenase (short-subunit alcohol dehydrogenase family)